MMTENFSPTPFNTPLEAGIRSLAILTAAYPESFDLQRLVEMDYLVVHSGDAGGPASLHVALPMRAGELLVRRGLIEKGLHLLMSKELIERSSETDGFEYIAGENAAPFMASLGARYSRELKKRASWAVNRFENTPTVEVKQLTDRLFAEWTIQFQASESSGLSND